MKHQQSEIVSAISVARSDMMSEPGSSKFKGDFGANSSVSSGFSMGTVDVEELR